MMRYSIFIVWLLFCCNVSATTYDYNNSGKLKQATYDGGSTAYYQYDSNGNLLSISQNALPEETDTSNNDHSQTDAPGDSGSGGGGGSIGFGFLLITASCLMATRKKRKQ